MRTQHCLSFFASTVMVLVGAAQQVGASVYSDAVQADSPLAYYQFSETSGSTVTDTMGLKDGSITGAPTLGAAGLTAVGMGASNTAINFGGAGSGDSIDLDQAVSTAMVGASAITTEMWIKNTPTNSTAQNLMTLLANTAAGANLAVLNGDIRGGGRSNSTDGYKSYTFVDIPTDGPDGWTYVVAINDYANAKAILYLNGSPIVNADITGWSATTYQIGANAGRSDRIAATSNSSDAATGEAGGLIDEVAFYNYALTPQQVMDHYNAALPEPASLMLLAAGSVALLRSRKR